MRFREIRAPALRDCAEPGTRSIQGCACSEFTDWPDAARFTVLRVDYAKRQPHLVGLGELKVRRHHTDYDQLPAVHVNRFADDGRVRAKMCFPQAITQDDHLLESSGRRLLLAEMAAHLRLHPEHAKQIWRDRGSFYPNCLIA